MAGDAVSIATAAANVTFNGWVSYLADWASLIGLVASIVSLVISAFALSGISRVRQELTLRSLLPEMIVALEELNSQGNSIISQFDKREEEYGPLMARCIANLRPLTELKNRAASDARRSLQLIELYIRPKKGFMHRGGRSLTVFEKKESARKIYTELNLLIEEMKRLVKEQNLGA